MRVLLVSHAFPPDGIAGVERYTEGLAGELAAAGDAVSVATGVRGDLCELRRERGDRATVYRITRPRTAHGRFLEHSRAMDRLFESVLEEADPDVVHVNHLIGLSPRFIEAAHRHGAAVVLSLWDHYFVCTRYQLVTTSGLNCAGPRAGLECARTCFADEGTAAPQRWTARTAYFHLLLQTAERLLFPSRYVASYFAPYVRDPARVRLLPLGLPGPLPPRVERAFARRSDAEPLRVAVLGLVFANKGAHVVLEALELAALKRARLSIHGRIVEPKYAEALEQHASAIPGLEFALRGAYGRDQLPILLEDADCVVVPSQWPETFAFVAREALALGVPVLAARMGALPEAIAEGRNGFTFAHDDPADLARLLRRLDADRNLLRRLAAGARDRAPVAPSAHAGSVQSVYREAIEDFARGGATTEADRRDLAGLEQRLSELGFNGR